MFEPRGLKRTMDIVGSVLALILLFPLLVLIAIAIKSTSKGPVLFGQRRIGQHGRPFMLLKFRSMYFGNDAYVLKAITANTEGHSHEGVFKLTRDPRITPLGIFLRRSSLDELPQILNVLNGDMSLVDLWSRIL